MNLQEALARIAVLEQECSSLRQRLDYLEYNPKLAAGLQGERVVSRLVGGLMTIFTAKSDVTIEHSGKVLEVKYSTLNLAVAKRSQTKRWTWSRPLGEQGGKIYDRLILLGVKDDRFSASYVDSESAYVIFDVPFEAVQELMTSAGRHFNIQITTNPVSVTTRRAQKLFQIFQVSRAELTKR